MNFQLVGPNGLPLLCSCGQPATVIRQDTVSSRETGYYCAQHDPWGPPCPLCEGSGHLPVT